MKSMRGRQQQQRWRRRRRGDAGSVTAETAVVLPVLFLVLVLGLWLVSAAVVALRCGDAARESARALARGESPAVVRAAGLKGAPGGARLSVDRDGKVVRVRVETQVRPLGFWVDVFPGLPVSATVAVAVEE